MTKDRLLLIDDNTLTKLKRYYGEKSKSNVSRKFNIFIVGGIILSLLILIYRYYSKNKKE